MRQLWAKLLFDDPSRIDELCFSPDAIALVGPPEAFTRVALILCYGDRSKQEPGQGALKLAYYNDGGTCNHPPTRFTKGGKGSNYCNKGPHEKRWLPQKPEWNDGVDKLFMYLLGP